MKNKQRGYVDGVGSAITFLMAFLGLFWFLAGLGLGYWIWG